MFSKRLLSWVARAAVSGALLVLVFRQVELRDVQALLVSARIELLLLIFIQLYANTAISTLKWTLILRADGIRLPFFQLLNSYLVGTFMNAFLPSTVGGDVYRVVDVAHRSRRTAGTFASVLADRLAGFIALAVLGAVFGLLDLQLLPEWRVVLVPFAVLAVLLVALALLVQQRLLRAIIAGTALVRVPYAAHFLEQLLDSVAQYRRAPGLFAYALAISFAFQMNIILSVFVLSRALSLDIPFAHLCVFVPIVSLIEAVPITINGLGLREVGYTALLVPTGVARADSLGLALAYMLVQLVYSLLGGLIFFARGVRTPVRNDDVAPAVRSQADGPRAGDTMRIAVMLRSLDEKGGIGVYTRNLTETLLSIDRQNEYLLLYRNPAHLGRFAHLPNVAERVVPGSNKAVWDQIGVPLALRRERVDVILHPKFTVPFFAPAKSVMVLHGADWFLPDAAHFYSRLDRVYMHLVMPWYLKRAAAVLSVSQLTTDHFNRIFRMPPGKIRTTYFGPARHFGRVADPAVLARVKARYRLPDRFILTLSKVTGGERKNAGGIFRAYERVHGTVPHQLVVAGQGCERFREDYGVPRTGWGADVCFPGWIDQEDLPAVYTLSDLLLYPSNMEAFPIPITEAMTCGTPIVTSAANGLREIAGDAAVLVDPSDPDAVAAAVRHVLGDASLRARLASAGLERSRRFSWVSCARQTLLALEQTVRGRPAVAVAASV